jgi:hypothetical protein
MVVSADADTVRRLRSKSSSSLVMQIRNLCGIGYYRGGDGNCHPYRHHYHYWWSGGVKHCKALMASFDPKVAGRGAMRAQELAHQLQRRMFVSDEEPALWQDDEAFDAVRAFDDFERATEVSSSPLESPAPDSRRRRRASAGMDASRTTPSTARRHRDPECRRGAQGRASGGLAYRREYAPSHGVCEVKLVYFGIAHSPGRSDPKREPVFAMQP